MGLRTGAVHLLIANQRRAAFTLALALGTATLWPVSVEAEEERSSPLPFLAVEQDGRLIAMPLRSTDIEIMVSGFVAAGEITQRYENPHRDPIEVVYVFPLPRRAAVSGYSLRVGDREIAGEIRRREEAAREYEQARSRGHVAGILAQHRTNVFEQRVANVPPGETIEVRIGWDQPLDFDAGVFSLMVPTVVAPRYDSPRGTEPETGFRSPPIVMHPDRLDHRLSLAVDIDAGLSIMSIESPSHDLAEIARNGRYAGVRTEEWESEANRDFVLRWSVSEDRPVLGALAHSDERGGFFSLMLVPPIRPREGEAPPREVVFVVDVSGSMNGLPLHLSKEAMEAALDGLRPQDTFDIMTFAGHATRAFGRAEAATSERIEQARRFLRSVQAGGGTEMMNAVHAALGPNLESDRHRYVFFLTDGYLTNEAQLMAAVREHTDRHDRHERRARVFAFGVGSSINRSLIDGLAEAGRGEAVYATNREDPTSAVRRFYELVDHPVLSDVEIDWGSVPIDKESLLPSAIPELRAGRPLLIHGRYHASGKGMVRLHGYTDGGDRVELPLRLSLDSEGGEHPALPRMWARSRVDELTKRLWSEGRRIDAAVMAEVQESVAKLGLEYGLVTSQTSFVAVDRSRRVGDGSPLLVEQAIAPPEDVDPIMAGGRRGIGSYGGGSALGIGGLGARGTAAGDAWGLGGGRHAAERGGVAIQGLNATLASEPGTGDGGAGARGGASALGGLSGDRSSSSGHGRVDLGGRGRAATRVQVEIEEVQGGLEEEVVARIVRRHTNELRYCYERRLQVEPGTAGTVVLEVVLREDGTVARVDTVENETTIASDEVVSCMNTRLQRWRFPEPRDGRVVTFRIKITCASGA